MRGNLIAKLSSDKNAVSFCDSNGISILNYGGLKAWDSNGTPLSTRFQLIANQRLAVEIDDRRAKYPIRIDPIAQRAYLKASNTHSAALFGDRVAICGNTVVVGAYSEYSNGVGVNGSQTSLTRPASGAVYVFVKTNGTWTQEAYLKASNPDTDDYFGGAVAISHDTIVVGAGTESSSSTGVNGDQNNNSSYRSGAVYVFRRSGTSWQQEAYIKASNTGSDDRFGAAVSIDGDTMVVGALREDSNATGIDGSQNNDDSFNSGAAYVFHRNGSTWTQQAYLKASNSGDGDNFGISVAVSGETIVVGAWNEDSNATGVNGDQQNNDSANSGAAYVYRRTGETWIQQAYLKASNTDDYDNYEQFGWDVAVHGDTIAVSSRYEASISRGINGDQTDNSNTSGAVYVYRRDNNDTWQQEAYIKSSNSDGGDDFGAAISLSKDILVVGANLEDSNATGIDGDQDNNDYYDSGAAYVFRRHGTNWTQTHYLKASNTDAYDSFGLSVGVSCGRLVIGAPRESSPSVGVNGDQGNNMGTGSSGAAYLFEIPEMNFADSMETHGLTGELAAFDADADLDGIKNGIEWIFGTDPSINASRIAPLFGLTSNSATFEFPRTDDSECSTDVSIEWSTDLATWSSIPVHEISSQGVSVTENGSNTDSVTVTIPRTNEEDGKLFMRTKATLRVCP